MEIGTSSGNGKGCQQVLYVVVTGEDLVLRIELHGDRAFVSDYVRDGVNVTGFGNPDNLALDPFGSPYITEDDGPGDVWVAKANGGPRRVASEVARFASLTDCAAEPSGIYFDRNGQTLWVNVQHAGGPLGNDLTMAIRRERRRAANRGRDQNRGRGQTGSEPRTG